MASNQVTTESLNEVVIRLLALNDGDELSYQTYFERIKKKLFTARLGNKELPREEDELLRNELKRVKKIKDQGLRFKVKKVKVNNRTTTVPPSTGPSTSPQYNNKKSSSAIVKRKDAIVKSKGGEIVSYDEQIKPKEKEEDKKEQKGFSNIQRTLDSILSILASKFKFEQKKSDEERRQEETEKRGKRESSLEGFKKGIGAIVSLTKKMLSPFDAVIERIKRFIFFTLLGRAFNMFMKWMENKENRKKFDSLIEFLADHWPAIAGLYILFGTSFGKLVRGLLKTAARMTVAFLTSIPKIVAFIKKNKGLSRLILTGLAASPFISKQIGEIFNPKDSKDAKISDDGTKELEDARTTIERTKDINAPGVNTGGLIPSTIDIQKPADTKLLASSSGGIIPKFNLGGLIPQFAMGGINPFGGFDFQQGVPITGAGKDDTLIAAKTGEAVLTEKDQQDLSSRYVDRETGQPLNIPEYLSDRKSSFVNLSNLKIAGGYYNGGIVGGMSNIIPKFNAGGIVGGASNFIPKFNTGGILGSTSSLLGGTSNRQKLSGGGSVKQPTTEDLARMMQSSTVRIEGSKYGTGVLVNNNDGEYTVLTAGHVIKGNRIGEEINIVTPDGKTHALKVSPENFKLFGDDVDLGTLKFNSKNNYSVATPGELKSLGRDDKVFVGGFPNHVEEKYNGNSRNPILRFIQGNMLPNSKGARREGYNMGYNMPTYPGMSGGPVFNSYGQLIGIHGSGIEDDTSTKQTEWGSSAIPISTYLGLGGKFGSNDKGSLSKPRILMNLLNSRFLTKENEDKNNYLQEKGFLNLDNIFRQTKSYEVQRKNNGGSIGEVGESEGTNIPGATADRQLFPITSGGFAALQPGEFVIPGPAVDKWGLGLMEYLAATGDSTSEARLNIGKVNGPNITPYRNLGSSGMEGMVTLPPIVAGGTGMNRPRASGLAGGSGVPSFPYRHPNGNHNMHAQIYGIGSMVG